MLERLMPLVMISVSACGGDDATSDSRREAAAAQKETLELVPSDATFAGKTHEEWAIEWRRWAFAQTDCEKDTQYDIDGSLCALHQAENSPVFFFDRGPRGTVRTKCQVPKGKAIAIPIALISNDNGGVKMPVPEQELREAVVEIHRSVRDLVLEVDEQSFPDLARMFIEPTKLSYYVPPAPNWYSCRQMTGVEDEVIEPVYMSGYLAILPPFKTAGTHTARYGYTLSYEGRSVLSDVTSTFEVK